MEDPSRTVPETIKEHQERERRLARAYRALAQCNRALVRSTSEAGLLEQLCRILVRVGGYELAWVGFADEDPGRSVRCVAQAGHSDGYLESIQVTWADEPHGRGPTGTAIRTGKPVINRNSETDPGLEPWRAAALERGLASSIALPLVLGGRAIGALTVYASRLDAFDVDEEELLLRLSEDMAFGIGALRDHAERERAESRLRERERLYREIVQNFPDGALGLYDHELRHVVIDGEGLADIGQSRASLEGRTLGEVFPPGLLARVEPLYRAALQGRASHAEVEFVGRWFDVHTRPVRGADGGADLGFVASVDVTERKRAEEATAASEELFRSAFEDASVGKALTSPEGRYVRVNRALCRMLGYGADELVGKHFSDVTHPDDRAGSHEGLRRMLAGEAATLRLEKRYVRKDGGTVWAEAGLGLVRAPDGRPRYVITDVQDVTARHLAEEQLRQSQKLEAVGLLAGGIAHDFNNLLTVMLGASAFALEEAPAEGPLREEVAEFHAAAEKARDLTRQLLAFSRQQVLEPRLLDLNHLVADAKKILGRVLGERIELRTRLAPALGPVFADPGQMHQVLMNLAVNARDAMPRGGTLTIDTANLARPEACDPESCRLGAGSCVRIGVEDTGVGMDQATRARIFEPFFTTKPVGKGTGLGLSTVFGIVKQSGGTIRVASTPGEGTRFEICLPQALASDVETAPSPPRAAAPGRHAILVVEDDEHVRRVTVRTLERAGFEVLAAATLEEAEARLDRHPRRPSVLLTDVRMPARSGPEVAAALAARVPGLRTVYMSGYSNEDVADEGVLPHGTFFVQKPFSPESLVERIRQAAESA